MLIVCKWYAIVSKIYVVSFSLIEPIFKPKIEVHHPAHNSLEIKCEKMDSALVWNGGKGTFRAEITYSGETITADPQNRCLFTFSDLYYLATYDVKVFESHFQHLPFIKAKESHGLELQCFTVHIYSFQITANNTEGHSAFITSEATTKCKNKLLSF